MVKIKICGVTTVHDALKAAELGVDALGLNFFKGSPRCITLDRAAEIVRELPPFVEPVAVFVNEPVERVKDTMRRLGLHTLQWHGDDCSPANLQPLRVLRAFGVRDKQSLQSIHVYLEECKNAGQAPAAILVDAHVPGSHGGTGQTLPWELLADFSPGVPLILAGGLHADNVAQAIRMVRPYAVDVASGVESSPGTKDHDKMKRFVDAVRHFDQK